MKKLPLYLATAVILGILVTVAPLITVAEIRGGNQKDGHFLSMWLRESLGQLEGSSSLSAPRSDASDFTVLTISFVIALTVYLYVKHRMPSRDFVWVRIPPY